MQARSDGIAHALIIIGHHASKIHQNNIKYPTIGHLDGRSGDNDDKKLNRSR